MSDKDVNKEKEKSNSIDLKISKWILGIAASLIVAHILWISTNIIDFNRRLTQVETNVANINQKLTTVPSLDYRTYIDSKFNSIEQDQDKLDNDIKDMQNKLDKILEKIQ